MMINRLLWAPLEQTCTLALKRDSDVPPFSAAHVVPAPQARMRIGLFFLAMKGCSGRWPLELCLAEVDPRPTPQITPSALPTSVKAATA